MSYGDKHEIDLSGVILQWDGSGLPPIGCICWYGDKKLEARIIAHIDQGESSGDMRFLAAGQLGELGPIAMAVEKHWAPIRTPEQIAADERQYAIEELAEVLISGSDAPTPYLWECAQRAYDAGYRKVKP